MDQIEFDSIRSKQLFFTPIGKLRIAYLQWFFYDRNNADLAIIVEVLDDPLCFRWLCFFLVVALGLSNLGYNGKIRLATAIFFF